MIIKYISAIIEAILVIAYFLIVFLIYGTLMHNMQILYMHIIDLQLTMAFLFTTIFLFEKAYRKDNGEFGYNKELRCLYFYQYIHLTVRYIAEKLNLIISNLFH